MRTRSAGCTGVAPVLTPKSLSLGILLLISTGCTSHTPFASLGGRSQNLIGNEPIIASGPTQLSQTTPFTPTDSSSDVATKKFVTSQSTFNDRLTTFPYLESSEKIPVIFPNARRSGAAYLKRDGQELLFESGPIAGSTFTLPELKTVGRKSYGSCESSRRDGSSIEMENQAWHSGIPLLKQIRARYKPNQGDPKEFLIFVYSGEKPDQVQLPKNPDLQWREFIQTPWLAAYLFNPEFKSYKTPYRTAEVSFSAKGDQNYLQLQRTPEGGPWVVLPIGKSSDPVSILSGKTSTGRTVKLFPAKMNQKPILVGVIREKDQSETWFVSLPNLSALNSSS